MRFANPPLFVSESSVRQSILIFALALDPILVDLAEAFPNVQITAYADNVIISGLLTDIKEVNGEFQRETFRAGLGLNTVEV